MGTTGAFALIKDKRDYDDISESVGADFLYYPLTESRDMFQQFISDGSLKEEDLNFCDCDYWDYRIVSPTTALESLTRIAEIYKSVNYVKVFNLTTNTYISDENEQYLLDGRPVDIPKGKTTLVTDTDLWMRHARIVPLRGLKTGKLEKYSVVNGVNVVEYETDFEVHDENFYGRHEAGFNKIFEICKKAEQIQMFLLLVVW